MKERSSKTEEMITEEFIAAIRERLAANERSRRTLPIWGRIHIDRQLPFLCIYRRPGAGNDPGTETLVTSEASYLICSAQRKLQAGLTDLVKAVGSTLAGNFGACLVIELWTGPPIDSSAPVALATLTPQFRLVAPKGAVSEAIMDELQTALSRIRLGKRKSKVTTTLSNRCCPKRLAPILSADVARQAGCHVLGLEVTPIYRDAATGEVFPGVLRELRRKLTVALRRTFFEFTRKHTTHHPAHFHTLGRNAVVKAVWEVDRMLSEASEEFDFLLQLTPVNAEQAWRELRRSRYTATPTFHYRPLSIEPVVLKRRLYRAPVERIEDPALARVFREKLDELDRQITMLQDRNTPRFVHESMQLFGGVEDDLHELALSILKRLPLHSRDEPTKGQLSAEGFAERARAEIEFFRGQSSAVRATVEIRDDISSLMVSRGNLLVSTQSKIPLGRVEALLQHEVGTHVLTYYNGRAQRFRLLAVGLAGYDALQEGLAVLSEHLVGQLSRPRLRLLAARVVAARCLIEGADFLETFHLLTRDHAFAPRIAFSVTMRIYRGGGLTKDVSYLRGLCQILDHLGNHGELEPLLIGKIAAQHVPIIRELQWRGILSEPPLTPRYLTDPEAQRRLTRVQQGMTVLDLMERKTS